KRSEKLRGKKKLVIDYKPLTHFLQDDKFPIPKASSLPVLIKESNIFSKFDLKSGFWQLGIDPSDRHKTAFCIPNAQYQWTVLPFGLKVAPSLFQKVMTRIFEPLLEHAIIYIDDILLFSKDIKTHKKNREIKNITVDMPVANSRRQKGIIIPLSKKHSLPEKTIQMITSTHSFPIIFMVKPSSQKAKTLQKPSSEKTNTRQKPLSNKAKTCRFFPLGLTPTSHPDILEYAKSHYFYFIHETMKYKVTTPFMFNPNNPYGGVFELFCDIGWDLQEATLWAIWCKTVEYSIPIALRTKAAYDILMNPDKEDYLFWTLLEWFSPLN
ncbi:hypothetical protein CR513_20921, partial [Mucuna pruriens]